MNILKAQSKYLKVNHGNYDYANEQEFTSNLKLLIDQYLIWKLKMKFQWKSRNDEK